MFTWNRCETSECSNATEQQLLSGDHFKKKYLSKGFLQIVFNSDSDTHLPGFQATWKLMEGEGEGGRLFGEKSQGTGWERRQLTAGEMV